MNVTEEQMQSILDEARPSIVDGLRIDLQKTITATINYEAKEEISKCVKSWIVENVIPEIEKDLIESKEGLISLGNRMAETTIQELAEAMTAALKENLTNSWSRKKVFEAMFD